MAANHKKAKFINTIITFTFLLVIGTFLLTNKKAKKVYALDIKTQKTYENINNKDTVVTLKTEDYDKLIVSCQYSIYDEKIGKSIKMFSETGTISNEEVKKAIMENLENIQFTEIKKIDYNHIKTNKELLYDIVLYKNNRKQGSVKFYDLDTIVYVVKNQVYISDKSKNDSEMINNSINNIITLFKPINFDEKAASKPLLESGQYYDYYNEIRGQSTVQISIYPTENELVGTYVNVENEETQLNGRIDGSTISLYYKDKNGIEKQLFVGNMKTVDEIDGIFTNKETNKKENMKLYLLSIIKAEYGSRYEGMGAKNDKEIELFAEKVKEAVTKDEKRKLANMIHYPINVDIDKEKVEISTKKEFVNKYNKIINKDFKDSIKKSFTRNMFTNYQGVMFGSGLKNMWFSYVEKNRKTGLFIISINN